MYTVLGEGTQQIGPIMFNTRDDMDRGSELSSKSSGYDSDNEAEDFWMRPRRKQRLQHRESKLGPPE